MINKILICLFIIFNCFTYIYSDTNQRPFSVVKIDLIFPASSMFLILKNSVSQDRTDFSIIVPIEYQWAFTRYTTINFNIWNFYYHNYQSNNMDLYDPTPGSGISLFPFGKAPDGLYIGADFLCPHNLNIYYRLNIGYQFIFNNFVLDIGGSWYIFKDFNNATILNIFTGFAF